MYWRVCQVCQNYIMALFLSVSIASHCCSYSLVGVIGWDNTISPGADYCQCIINTFVHGTILRSRSVHSINLSLNKNDPVSLPNQKQEYQYCLQYSLSLAMISNFCRWWPWNIIADQKYRIERIQCVLCLINMAGIYNETMHALDLII